MHSAAASHGAQTIFLQALHERDACERQRDLPPLDTLRGFDAAARHLSFTRAAEELHLTQSAMSRQVKALEEALGVALFERRHRALALTDAGRSLHRTVADVLEDAARGDREACAPAAPTGRSP